MNKYSLVRIILLGIFVISAAILSAAVPQLITYQGRLQDDTGNPVADGQYSIQFAVYDSLSGGKDFWNSGYVKVIVENGLFAVDLGGSHMPEIPSDLFTDTSLYLGVTIEGSSEMAPRTRLVTVPYSYHALRADSADMATVATSADNVDWTDINNMPAGFADGIDDASGGGDITAVEAGSGLSGGGDSGDVTLSLAGTIDNSHTFTGTTYFQSKTYHAGVTSEISTGVNNNYISAIESHVERTSSVGDYAYTNGVYASVEAPLGERRGVYGLVQGDGTKSNGESIGLRSIAWDGDKAYALYGWTYNAHQGYGVYVGAMTDYNDIAEAGHFYGNVAISGSISKGGGSFKIDHPLDPEGKYLQHSFVESPDMMNVYNGNITTDGNGYATVELPAYFEALNKDFRYQLTVIGEFSQAIIAQEISDNQFVIRTDQPNIKVSWQVTGVRQDDWANAHRIEVEIDKPAEEAGAYLYPREHGQPIEKDVEYEHIRKAREEYESRR